MALQVAIPAALFGLLTGGVRAGVGNWLRGRQMDRETAAINERNKNAVAVLQAAGLIPSGTTAETPTTEKPRAEPKAKQGRGILEGEFATVPPPLTEPSEPQEAKQPERFQAGAAAAQPAATQPSRFQPTGQPTLPAVDWALSAEGKLSFDANDAYYRQQQEMDFAKYYDQQWQMYRKEQGKSPRESKTFATRDAVSSFGIIKNMGDFLDAYKGMTPEERFNSARMWTVNQILSGAPVDMESLRQEATKTFPNLSDDDWNRIHEDIFELARALEMGKYSGVAEDEAYRRATLDAMDNIGRPAAMKREEFLTKSMRVSDLPDDQKAEALKRGMKPSDIVSPGEPYKAIEQQAFEVGQKRIVDTAQKRLIATERARVGAAAEVVLPMLRRVRGYAEALNTEEGLARITGKVGKTLKGWWQTSEDMVMVGDREMTVGAAAKQYMDWSKVLLAKMARAFGEVGVLTEFDIQRAKGALAVLGSGAELTRIKFDDMEELFTELMVRANMVKEGKTPDLPGPALTLQEAVKQSKDLTFDDLLPGSEDRFNFTPPGAK